METFFYRFKVSYKGTDYLGWQKQKGPGKTIQGEIHKALGQICKVSPAKIKTLGGGRTDAGVHALGQVFRAELPLSLPTSALTRGMNSLLPKDIQILEAGPCDPQFRPIQDAYWKEYQYLFCVGAAPSPFARDFLAHMAHPLDIFLMEKACQILVGTHDFCNFFCVGTKVSTTIRTIYFCDLKLVQPENYFGQTWPSYYIFRVIGNGFLKQMVRLIVGSLWAVGQKKVTLEDFQEALTRKRTKKLGPVAPPEGLYLKEINYTHQWH